MARLAAPLLTAPLFAAPRRAAAAQTGPLGGEASFEFVDYMRNNRIFTAPAGGAVAMDGEGWPLGDAMAVPFDLRPTHAWAPPMDDPDQRQADLTGTWAVSLKGRADMALGEHIPGVTLSDAAFNATSFVTTAKITFAPGKYPKTADLLSLTLTNTQRNATHKGFTDMRVIHPDYVGKPEQLFTDNWAKVMSVFDHLRFMGITGTNSYAWNCGEEPGVKGWPANAVQCSIVEWAERALPSHAFWKDTTLGAGCHGTPWEFVILAANQLGKDIWINVPVTASAPGGPDVTGLRTPSDPKQTYVYKLAELLRDGNEFTGGVGLKKNINIYVEHSNEVWNYGFKQEQLNRAAAVAEVNFTKGKSNLAADAGTGYRWGNCTYEPTAQNGACWAHRRHARRLYEIAQTFEGVFGAGTLNKRIRPVYASWTIYPDEYYNHTLTWMEQQFGPVKDYFYALSTTAYFGPQAQDAKGHNINYDFENHTVAEIVRAFSDGAKANAEITQTFANLKKKFGLKYASYESGPGAKVGGLKPGSVGLNHLIEANRDPGMKDAVLTDVRDNFWANGGDIYNYFSVEGYCSTYGCWGAVEDWKQVTGSSVPPKLQAIYELTGKHP